MEEEQIEGIRVAEGNVSRLATPKNLCWKPRSALRGERRGQTRGAKTDEPMCSVDVHDEVTFTDYHPKDVMPKAVLRKKD